MQEVAPGVRVHQSALIQNNSVVVQGRTGVLVVDPGLTGDEMTDLANDIHESGGMVVAGFSTHPDWDHVLWHPDLGNVPRYATAGGADVMRRLLSKEDWRAHAAEGLEWVTGLHSWQLRSLSERNLLGVATSGP